MDFDEVKKLADAGDLDACRMLFIHYNEEDKILDALPYVEKLALSGDTECFGITAMIYTVIGKAHLEIGLPLEAALEKFEKAVEWANKSQDEASIVSANQGLGECYFRLGVRFRKIDESLSKNYYVKAYNTLVDTVGESQQKQYDLIWALSADVLEDIGLNIPDNAKSRKWSILFDSFNNRESIKEESTRYEGYLSKCAISLGFGLLEGKEMERDDTAAFAVFSAAHKELNIDMSNILSKFVKNADSTYSYQE